MVINRILQYLDHLQDVDYLAAIATSAPMPEFCHTISTLLQSEEEEVIHLTCLFITDLLLVD